MSILREWAQRLRSTVRPARRDEDLEEELHLHLELVAEEARRRGHDPEAAVRLARLDVGGSSQAMDALRDQRGLPWLDDLARDFGFALRIFRRRPGFTATAMLSLALGIGANTGIFSLIDQVLLRLLPVRDAGRIVRLVWQGPPLARLTFGDGNVVSYPLCRDLQRHTQVFEGVLCRHPGQFNLSTGQQYEQVNAELVSGSYFEVLGVGAAAGRVLGRFDDVTPGAHPVAVLSHEYWQTHFGGDPNVVGRRVLVNTHPMTVVGVAAKGFRGMDVTTPASVWVPALMAREATVEFDRMLDRRAFWMHAFARLRPGVTPEQAKAALQPSFKAMLEDDSGLEGFPPTTPSELQAYFASTLDVEPGAQGWSRLGGIMAQPLWALLVGTTLLLLLACLNVASLLLARGAERSQELTTRVALGATSGRIMRQLTAEGLLIAVFGGALGLLAAPVVTRLLLRFLPEGVELAAGVDLRIFVFALAVTAAAGVLCGLAPAVQARRRPLAASINGRTPASGSSVRLRKVIVGAQLALTLVLLAGAGLFVQTLTSLYAKDRGFDSSRLLMFRADPAGTGATAADAPRVMRDLVQTLRALPDVESAAVSNNMLLGALGAGRVLTIEAGQRIVLDQPVPMMRVGSAFFSTLGVEVIAGREFEDRDTVGHENTGVRTLVVNESFARRYFGDRSPIGSLVGIGNRPDTPVDVEIVGVVSDFSRRFLRDDAQPEHIFFPFAQDGPQAGDGAIYVRTRGAPESALGSIRAVVAGIDARMPLINLTTLDDQIGRALRSEVMLATLSSSFGAVALLLSVVGLFGVMSFVVTQRTQEIGMRMALGATRASAIWLIIRDALATIGAGTAVGVAVAVAATLRLAPWLSGVLYGVSPSDVATFVGAATVMPVVALAACLIPAGRAAVLSPMVAIREQQGSAWRAARDTVGRAVRQIAATADRTAAPGTLIADVTGTMRQAESFPAALSAALASLRERVGAGSIRLLEKRGDVYRDGAMAIPARGVLINRLRHYPHPLPLTDGDFRSWQEWAGQLRPEHLPEIGQLRDAGACLAIPLRTAHELVGVLLLGPPADRPHFSQAERDVLSRAGDVFALLIENGRLNERALDQEKLRRDVALAAEVQRRLLPSQLPHCAAAGFAAFTLPARIIGGDYYDFIELSNGCIGIAVADIAGKGVPAALLMSSVQASLRVLTAQGLAAAPLAARMNHFLYESSGTSSYATFFYAQLDPAARRLRYVNAGHNPPYLFRPDGAGVQIMELSVGGMVVGLFPGASYEDCEIEVRPGDLLLAFTDGVTEARNAADEEFGEERLQEFVVAAIARPIDELSAALAARVRDWIGEAEQHDDVTFVIVAVS